MQKREIYTKFGMFKLKFYNVKTFYLEKIKLNRIFLAIL